MVFEPKNPFPRLFAAEIEIQLGAFDAAERLLCEAVVLFPDSPGAWGALAQLQLWKGNARIALKFAEKAVRLDKKCFVGLRVRGGAKAYLSRPGEALTDLSSALQACPSDIESYVWRSEAHRAIGRVSEAISDSQSALALAGDCLGAAINFALAVFKSSESDPAWKDAWWKVLEIGWRRSLVRSMRLPASKGAAEQAAQSLLRRLGGNRSTMTTLVRDDRRLVLCRPNISQKAVLIQRQLKWRPQGDVLRTLDRLHERHPLRVEPLLYRAETLLWIGEYAKAQKDMHRAMRLKLQRSYYPYLGLCLSEMLLTGRMDEALRWCDCGTSIPPYPFPAKRSAAFYAFRGEALRRTGRIQEAVGDFYEALRLKPARLSAWVNLSLALDAAADPKAAHRIFDALAKWAPGLMHEAVCRAGVPSSPSSLSGNSPESRSAVLERMLESMRGNRSSWMPIYWNSAGKMICVELEPAREEMRLLAASLTDLKTSK